MILENEFLQKNVNYRGNEEIFLRVEPSLEFGLDTERHSQRRRSSVQDVIFTLGHEIQRVPDLVVNEAKKVLINILRRYFWHHLMKTLTHIYIIIFVCMMALGWQDPEHITVRGPLYETKHHILLGIYVIEHFELCY